MTDAVLRKIKSSHPTDPTPAKATAKDVLAEVREMNKNNIEFYEALLGEISKLKTDCDVERVVMLENSLEEHKSETDDKFSGYENRLIVLETENNNLKKENERLSEKSLELECRSRKLNLIIGNIAEKPGVNSKETYDEIPYTRKW